MNASLLLNVQIKKRWGVLRRAISNEILDFVSGYDPGFERQLGISPRPGTQAALRDPQRKQQLWLDVWCRIADMIAAHETGYVRAFPSKSEWASRASESLRAGLLDFQQKLCVEHSDMPQFEELRFDPATGRHYAVVGASLPRTKGVPS